MFGGSLLTCTVDWGMPEAPLTFTKAYQNLTRVAFVTSRLPSWYSSQSRFFFFSVPLVFIDYTIFVLLHFSHIGLWRMSFFFASFKVMLRDSGSDSGSVYLPGSSDKEESDESYVSKERELENDSDEELCEECEPLIEDGWQFMSDTFEDSRPTPLPVFGDSDVGIAASVPQFTCPCTAFCYFFDSAVIGKLCE